jgi:glycerol-3-phosphate dehydrogenase
VSVAERFDVLIVGGGIHGVGVAQAAAAAGYSVLLLEQTSLAAGTSSRSSKLIHGGLRYLETLHFGLVRESLRERELLLKLAPELVRRQMFMIPIYPFTSRRPWTLNLGLSLYTILAGLRSRSGFRSIPPSEWSRLDGLRTDDLQKVLQYWDAQTDDLRLTQAVMDSAISLGAELRCPAEFLEASVTSAGCIARFRQADAEHEVHATVLVNAAGPWGTDIAARIRPAPPTPAVDLVQGTHLELPGAITAGCYYLEAPQDGRAVFVMPWHDRTLLGTTELVYHGNPAKCSATLTETHYLLEVFQYYFPQRNTDVLDQWAGLRVLPSSKANASKRSRETQLPVDNERQPRVLSIFGGKLTGYRATAEKVVQRLKLTLPERKPVASTSKLPLRPR